MQNTPVKPCHYSFLTLGLKFWVFVVKYHRKRQEIMIKKNIFCVGIDEKTVAALKNYFSDSFDMDSLATANELLNKIRNYKPTLLFLNNILPDFDNCQELCIGIRSRANTETVPIIILTSNPNTKEKITLFQAGLIDGYFTTPINIEELAAYASVFLQRQFLQEELEEKNRLLSNISITDDLMDIYNRRFLMRRLDEELKKIKRYEYPFSALMIDLDFFKKINDRYGHIQGDITLKGLAELLKNNVRAMDIICRYGGEEIVILMPHINFHGAKITAERLRSKVKAHDFGSKEASIFLTVSVGLMSFDSRDDLTVDKAIQALDKQLYQAKNTGRNKVCAAAFKDIKI